MNCTFVFAVTFDWFVVTLLVCFLTFVTSIILIIGIRKVSTHLKEIWLRCKEIWECKQCVPTWIGKVLSPNGRDAWSLRTLQWSKRYSWLSKWEIIEANVVNLCRWERETDSLSEELTVKRRNTATSRTRSDPASFALFECFQNVKNKLRKKEKERHRAFRPCWKERPSAVMCALLLSSSCHGPLPLQPRTALRWRTPPPQWRWWVPLFCTWSHIRNYPRAWLNNKNGF